MFSSNYVDIRHILLLNHSPAAVPHAHPRAAPSAHIDTLKALSLILTQKGTKYASGKVKEQAWGTPSMENMSPHLQCHPEVTTVRTILMGPNACH